MRTARLHLFATALALLAAIAVLGSPSQAHARKGGPFGIGVELGDPSGLSFKYFAGRNTAIDGGLGFSVRHDWVRLHLDYLFHFPTRAGGAELLPYIGIGGKLAIWDGGRHDKDWYEDDDDFGLGVRIPFGVAWHPGSVPIDLFAEIVPGLWILPGTGFDFDFAIGVRFFF